MEMEKASKGEENKTASKEYESRRGIATTEQL